MKRFSSVVLLLVVLGFLAPAEAQLFDRGGGLIYDTALNITWLQNANLAATSTFGVSGIEAAGTMNWNTARTWIAALNAAKYLGFSNWRLPTTPGTTFDYTAEGEMGHLYYIELGNPAGEGGLSNTGPFKNWARWYYWTGTETGPGSDSAFDFRFNDGYQGASYRELHKLYAWAVRDGDVAAPEPATLILFEDFEDPSGFTVGGGYARFWGVAPLSGTQDIPSNFVQGGSQSGAIFYGSFAKQYQGSPAATMTINLPDLTGYTNLRLVVALAAPDGIWEPTHRDSLHIIGGTASSPVPEVACTAAGCVPVSGAIDSFLPPAYPASLRSKVYSIDLDHQFQDFEYTIDNSLTSLTFAFASTDYPEIIGIDSVRIMGDPIVPVPEPISIDIKPGRDPNSINPKSNGKIPVAILSINDFNAPGMVDQESLTFGSTGYEDSLAFCNPKGEDINKDGLKDLVCHFYTQEAGFECGDIEGVLKGKTMDGKPIEGSDSVRVNPCKK